MPRGITRKDYTLLRDGQAPDNLFGDEEAGAKPRGATVWRLFGLANQEVFVSAVLEFQLPATSDQLGLRSIFRDLCIGHHSGHSSSSCGFVVHSGSAQASWGPH